MTDTVIEFLSRECKIGQHQNCCGKWQGLGFEISYGCVCSHKKNCWALEQVEERVSNTNESVQPLSVQGVLHQEND
jgi:hypothetical protein